MLQTELLFFGLAHSVTKILSVSQSDHFLTCQAVYHIPNVLTITKSTQIIHLMSIVNNI